MAMSIRAKASFAEIRIWPGRSSVHHTRGAEYPNRPDRVDQRHEPETVRRDRARSLRSSSVPVAATRSPT